MGKAVFSFAHGLYPGSCSVKRTEDNARLLGPPQALELGKQQGTAPGAEPPPHKRPLQWGAWVAQSVEHPTSAQVMISWSVGSSPALGSVLTAQSLEPASDSAAPSLSAPPPLMLCLSLSLSLALSKNK